MLPWEALDDYRRNTNTPMPNTRTPDPLGPDDRADSKNPLDLDDVLSKSVGRVEKYHKLLGQNATFWPFWDDIRKS